MCINHPRSTEVPCPTENRFCPGIGGCGDPGIRPRLEQESFIHNDLRSTTVRVTGFVTGFAGFRSARLPELLPERSEGERGPEYALLLLEQSHDVADRFGVPLDEDGFDAGVVIEMDVSVGQDCALELMLEIGQLLGQPSDMMVVEKGHGPDDVLIRTPLALNDPVPDHVPDELGPISISRFGHQLLEPAHQRLLDTEAQSHNVRHAKSSLYWILPFRGDTDGQRDLRQASPGPIHHSFL